jgi:hypothetical protein
MHELLPGFEACVRVELSVLAIKPIAWYICLFLPDIVLSSLLNHLLVSGISSLI